MAAQDKKRQGRPPLAEPKSVPVTVRVTRAMERDIDRARGVTPRSVWIENLIVAELAPSPAASAAQVAAQDCPHPSSGVDGDYCATCKQDIF